MERDWNLLTLLGNVVGGSGSMKEIVSFFVIWLLFFIKSDNNYLSSKNQNSFQNNFSKFMNKNLISVSTLIKWYLRFLNE